MKKVIQTTLNGYPATFQLDEDADDALQCYLDRAKSRLGNDPDREEVLRDLEQSIAEKLACLPDRATRVVRRSDVDSVLEEIGVVDTGNTHTIAPEPHSNRRRRFYRIQQGQWLAGVCTGLAVYSSIRVNRVRLIVVILSLFIPFLALALIFSSFLLGLFTAALPLLIYVALVFITPVAATRDECVSRYSERSNAA